jgi:hypothetical protein
VLGSASSVFHSRHTPVVKPFQATGRRTQRPAECYHSAPHMILPQKFSSGYQTAPTLALATGSDALPDFSPSAFLRQS